MTVLPAVLSRTNWRARLQLLRMHCGCSVFSGGQSRGQLPPLLQEPQDL